MRMFEKNELKLLWPFYLEAFLSYTLFFAPAFFVIYFVDAGLSLFQVSLVFAIQGLAALLFEIPTSAIADIYGRKFSVILSYALEGLGFFMLFFSKNFYFILFCFAFIGFASTFSSGSKEAWAVDLIKARNRKLMNNFFSKVQILDNAGMILAGILGAFLVWAAGTSLIWIFAGISFLVSCFILAFSKEVFRKRAIVHPYKVLKNQIRGSLGFSYKHPVLFYLLLATFVFIFGASFDIDVSWVPLLKSLGVSDYIFGYFWSATSLVIIASSFISMKFLKKNRERNFIIMFVLLSALNSFLVLAVYNKIFGIVLYLLSFFFFHGMKPASRIYFHRFVPNKMRATIGGFENMLWGVAAVLALPISGLLVDAVGPRYTIAVAGVMSILTVLVYLMIREKKQN